jgi:hypothetical protein
LNPTWPELVRKSAFGVCVREATPSRTTTGAKLEAES